MIYNFRIFSSTIFLVCTLVQFTVSVVSTSREVKAVGPQGNQGGLNRNNGSNLNGTSACKGPVFSPLTDSSETSERCPIYTYYEDLTHFSHQVHMSTLKSWARHWYSVGFMPLILSRQQAASHPLYKKFRKRMRKLPTVNPKNYEMACYLRWLAFEQIGGGIMVDFDVVYFGPYGQKPFECLKNCGKSEILGPKNSFFPMMAHGSRRQISQILITRLFNHAPGNAPKVERFKGGKLIKAKHISDMKILQDPKFIKTLKKSSCVEHLIHVTTEMSKAYDRNDLRKSNIINMLLQAKFLNHRAIIYVDTISKYSSEYQEASSTERLFISVILGRLTGFELPLECGAADTTATSRSMVRKTSCVFQNVKKIRNLLSKPLQKIINSSIDFIAEEAAQFPCHFHTIAKLNLQNRGNVTETLHMYKRKYYFAFLEDPHVILFDQLTKYKRSKKAENSEDTNFKDFMESCYFKPNSQSTQIFGLASTSDIEELFKREDLFIGLQPDLPNSLTVLEYQLGLDFSELKVSDIQFPNLLFNTNNYREEALVYFENLMKVNSDCAATLYLDNYFDFLLYDLAQKNIQNHLRNVRFIEQQIENLET